MAPHRRKRLLRTARSRKADAQKHLERAEQLRAAASAALTEQQGKLASEQPLRQTMQELAETNHLSALVWEIVGD